MTVQGTFSVTIDATPDAVWAWVADLSKHPDWSPKPYTVELVSGEAGNVGSRYRSVGWIPNDKHHSNEVEIAEAEPNRRLVLNAIDPMGIFTNTYVLQPSDKGTEVTYSLVFPPLKGAAAVMAPVAFSLLGKKDVNTRPGMLKDKVESGA